MNRPIIATLLLVFMSCVGVGLGIWLFQTGNVLLGSLWITIWMWNAKRFAIWLIVPRRPVEPQPFTSFQQRMTIAIISVLAAGICGVGAYVWYLWPEEWQAGLVFILVGMIVLIPVTIREIQVRRKLLTSWQ